MLLSIDRRLGKWSAIAIFVFDVIYVLTGAICLVRSPDSFARPKLEPEEPYLAILELLILLSAPALVALFSAIHAWAPPDRKSCSLAALGFVVLLAGLTGAVHFVQLTVGRQAKGMGILGRHGCVIVREGRRHTIVRNTLSGAESQAPRHRETKRPLPAASVRNSVLNRQVNHEIRKSDFFWFRMTKNFF